MQVLSGKGKLPWFKYLNGIVMFFKYYNLHWQFSRLDIVKVNGMQTQSPISPFSILAIAALRTIYHYYSFGCDHCLSTNADLRRTALSTWRASKD